MIMPSRCRDSSRRVSSRAAMQRLIREICDSTSALSISVFVLQCMDALVLDITNETVVRARARLIIDDPFAGGGIGLSANLSAHSARIESNASCVHRLT